jgi:hypothetical protein
MEIEPKELHERVPFLWKLQYGWKAEEFMLEAKLSKY